jgi:arylsulfatase A-like enzyme
MKNVVVLVIDRLGAGYLGPYGNTWIETPNFNRLASQSLVIEYAMTDAADVRRVYRSFWRGLHAMSPDTPTEGLMEIVQATDIHAALVTDDPQLADLPPAQGFHERLVLPARPRETPACEIDQTQMAQVFAAAVEWIASAPEPFLLWIHAQGMDGAWDAPLEFRNQFADEDDPLPPPLVKPPAIRLSEDFDPDELLGFQHAYAGQVVLLDMCLGVLLEALQSASAWEDCLFFVTSPRGFPLGEHGFVGGCDDRLYGELVHVPLICRLPEETGAGLRRHAFVQPGDLCATLLDWLDLQPEVPAMWGESLLSLMIPDPPMWRDRMGALAASCAAIRTPAWFFLRHADGRDELFAKPDDRWEANEVSSLCREAVSGLVEALDEFRRAAQSPQSSQLAPLSRLLVEGLD